jgi:uncharacterized protein (UPF0264 family)
MVWVSERVQSVITTSSRRTIDRVSHGLAIPRLLVSVRSRVEAARAVEGGAQILDVKEPDRGSLGMADLGVIEEIAGHLRECRLAGPEDRSLETPPPLSVALGELQDWIGRVEVPALPHEVTFAKLGLRNLAGVSEWQAEWQRIRNDFDRQRSVPLKWVAVAYADETAACSPSLDDVFTVAANSRCAGLLIDTVTKSGQSLPDFVPLSKLIETAGRCHAAGMFLAIAGSLTIETLPQLGNVNADIVAIRSAACRDANRRNAVDLTRVADFRAALGDVFCGQPSSSHGEE